MIHADVNFNNTNIVKNKQHNTGEYGMSQTTEFVLEMIEQSPTAFHAVETVRGEAEKRGFQRLSESRPWDLRQGGRYYVMRNHSSIISFILPEKAPETFRITASHSDSPCFKVKANPEMEASGAYVKLNVERYGGMIVQSWLDRPLSLAGRVFFDDKDGRLREKLVDIDRDLLMIPSLAIHMNKTVNKGQELNLQTDMLPVLAETLTEAMSSALTSGGGDGMADENDNNDNNNCSNNERMDSKDAVGSLLAEELGISADKIYDYDLFVYNRMKPVHWGRNREFIASPRLDDLECCFTTLLGFLGQADEESEGTVRMHAVFDNEEVGSGTAQGADSTFLEDVMTRIADAFGLSRDQYLAAVASSIMLSCDNAHAVHPNHAEKADPVNRPVMNRGIVLKYDGSQKYTTDGFSGAFVRRLCRENDIPCQVFTNRSDMPGGSTLGNISQAHVSMHTADIGLPQLAMHSSYEAAGAKDPDAMVRLTRALFLSEPIDMEEVEA